jgi:hypothetical protein
MPARAARARARARAPWAATAAAALVCAQLAGCNDLDEFRTGTESLFQGEVIGSDSERDMDSFIRTGFSSHTRMQLSFNPYASGVAADGGESSPVLPGRVHTFVCPSDRPDCSAEQGEVGPFDHARLQPIESLAHDSLAEYTFPGGGRLRNYIYNVRFQSELEGDTLQRNAMIFISLMDSGKVEVRAIAASVPAAAGSEDVLPALFGVFVLKRQDR